MIGSNQQRGAQRKNAPQEDVIYQNPALKTRGGLSLAVGIIADGEGDSGAREAADLAAKTVVQTISRTTNNSINHILERAVEAANQALISDTVRDSTIPRPFVALCVAVIHQNQLFLANVGHTVAYFIHKKKSYLVTTKQTSCLGLANQVDAEIIKPFPLLPGDHVILCSDGLVGDIKQDGRKLINSDEMVGAVEEKNVDKAAQRLVTFPMSRNVDDNVSVIVFRVPGGIKALAKQNKTLTMLGGFAFLSVMVLVCFGLSRLGTVLRGSSPTPTSFPDSGMAILEYVDIPVVIFRPLDDESETISGNARIPAGYTIRTASGTARLLVLGTRVYLDKETEIILTQLESTDPEQQNVVIITLISGRILIMKEKGTHHQLIVKTPKELSIESPMNTTSSLGVIIQSEQTLIDCIKGPCYLETLEEQTEIKPGERVILINDSQKREQLSEEMIKRWENICRCEP